MIHLFLSINAMHLRIRMVYQPPPVAAEIFGKMRAMEHPLIIDMAMVPCFVW